MGGAGGGEVGGGGGWMVDVEIRGDFLRMGVDGRGEIAMKGLKMCAYTRLTFSTHCGPQSTQLEFQ